MAQIKIMSRYMKPFPKAPIPGTESIQPIQSYRQLVAEGRRQQHCVLSYHTRIMSGNYAVYRMLEPERATIGSYGCYILDQVKLHRNRTPSAETRELIRQWLMKEA
ncbi:MAG: PcfJ domain-containing protein [Mariprofundaceae bacterium]|nr:PcfJ domain-containing protein [Mariprofundaceae bacterium]